MVYEHDALISSYEHLAERPRASEALHTLRRVSTMVKPLMRQRGWRVGVLCEFYPEERNLLGLNWNRGARVCLRLRHAGDAAQFLPFEDVLDTMLHELAHIVHGPHDSHFHALWDALRDDYEALLRKGYTGEGFLSKGRRLGGAGVPAEEIRRQHRAAVRDRQQGGGRGGGGGVGGGGDGVAGRRLGGRRVRRDEDIRQVIADAAERRKTITGGCASAAPEADTRRIVDEASRNGFRTQAEEDAANEKAIMDAVMDLIEQDERERLGDAYVPPTKQQQQPASNPTPHASVSYPSSPPIPLATKPPATSSASRPSGPDQQQRQQQRPRPDQQRKAPPEPGWSCPACTLHNRPQHLACDACGSERPSGVSAADYRDDSTRLELDRLAAAARRGPQTQDMADGVSVPPPTRRGSSAVPQKRPAPKPGDGSGSTVLRPRSSAAKLAKVYEPPGDKPLGWNCAGCGSFMETEWWTCSMCGRMKQSS